MCMLSGTPTETTVLLAYAANQPPAVLRTTIAGEINCRYVVVSSGCRSASPFSLCRPDVEQQVRQLPNLGGVRSRASRR